MRLCDLSQKEVINICDCKCLGFVADVDIDPCSGCILTLLVPSCGKFFSIFGKKNEIAIPWGQVCKIGPDIILVEIPKPKG